MELTRHRGAIRFVLVYEAVRHDRIARTRLAHAPGWACGWVFCCVTRGV